MIKQGTLQSFASVVVYVLFSMCPLNSGITVNVLCFKRGNAAIGEIHNAFIMYQETGGVSYIYNVLVI